MEDPTLDPKNPATWPAFLDTDQVSLILATPIKTVCDLLKKKVIKGKKYGREWRVKASDLLAD